MSAAADAPAPAPGGAALRPAAEVMRLDRLGALHRSRLSFMPTLLRRLSSFGFRYDRPLWEMDARGVGRALLRVRGLGRSYTLVAFAHDLPPERRSDRVIAEAWDATFALVDGEVGPEDLARLEANVPLQEAGRVGPRELVLSRANKSVRAFEAVAGALAAGRAPDPALIERVGYLMRTTAVYGSGKFGAADREVWADRPEFRGAFQPEMLAVWLIRAFTLDLVEHVAHARAPDVAAPLPASTRRRLGIGNSTGLGMAPFLVNHPALLHAWIAARETGLARMRARPAAGPGEAARLAALLDAARADAEGWCVEDARYAARIAGLRADLARLAGRVAPAAAAPFPWDALHRAAADCGLEAQERLVSLLIDLGGEAMDDLAARMDADEDAEFAIEGAMRLGALREGARRAFDWALATDFARPEAQARLWYVSADKAEPRLAERGEAPLEPWEQPLATGRDVAAALRALEDEPDAARVGEALMRRPEHRHALRRVQRAMRLPYAEIRANLVDAALVPVDLLRCKLAFFGATRFDPRSDRWLRITMYRGAPTPEPTPPA
ncbi:MAG TPA: hypothetical protein VJ994_14940 [Paracoccaceae bacterium]|nr:hypothetical protein [Paracoccaceae bacterium]